MIWARASCFVSAGAGEAVRVAFAAASWLLVSEVVQADAVSVTVASVVSSRAARRARVCEGMRELRGGDQRERDGVVVADGEGTAVAAGGVRVSAAARTCFAARAR